MLRPDFAFFLCLLTVLLLLPQYCTSLSEDGVVLSKMKKGEWVDSFGALSDWNESHRNPCAWKGITCDALNSVTTVNLTGALVFGNLTSAICALSNLTAFVLQANLFSGPFPADLLRCNRLRKLDLSSNHFTGMLPAGISELSELRELNLSYNAFSGSVPPAFGMLPKLEALFFHDNRLSGAFPNFIGNLMCLRNFTIGGNPLRPSIVPTELKNLKQLQQLWLYNCSLEGRIPAFLGNLTQLELLDMRHNNLWGEIPASLMGLSNLRELVLYENHLSGRIPANIGQLRRLTYLDLCTNQLSGEIPREILLQKKLYQLNLSYNRLIGEIPVFRSNIDSFDLSNNLLSGGVPAELGQLKPSAFNLSNNQLSGRVPEGLDNSAYKESFLGNPRLCGGRNLMLPSCSSPPQRLATILLPALLTVVTLTLCSICLCLWCLRKPTDAPASWKMTPFHSTKVNVSYVLQNLKKSKVIGSGSSGKVYKVTMQDGQELLVKEMSKRSRSIGDHKRRIEKGENEFLGVEVDTLGLIRHINILNLLCLISSEQSDSELLVYEFMPNGRLSDCLHCGPGNIQKMVLPWKIRYQIALGAARGLCYMHHYFHHPLMHREVNSSNILLDGNFLPKIAYFGESIALGTLGVERVVYGYDVYNFGVVVLELVSGKKARGEVEFGEGMSIVEWIRSRTLMEVVDERIADANCVQQMMRVLDVGLMCTDSVPNRRPCMIRVVELLVACGEANSTFHRAESVVDCDSDDEAVYYAD